MRETALSFVDLKGFEELAYVLREELPKAMQNRIVKDAMYSVVNRKVIPLIKEEIKNSKLYRTGSLYHSIVIVKQDVKNKHRPRLVVGPGLLSEDQAFMKPVMQYNRPWYARFLEGGTKVRMGRGSVKPRRFMIKSYLTIKIEYQQWMREAIAERFAKWKANQLKKALKGKKVK